MKTITEVPGMIVPLDLANKTKSHIMVGYPESTNAPSKLKQTAFFDGTTSSFLKYTMVDPLKIKDGLSIGMWIFPRKSSEKMPFFRLYEKLSTYQIFLILQDDLLSVRLKDTAGGHFYSSYSSVNIDQWNFVGFTYSMKSMKGTLFINNTYGISDAEGSYFELDAVDLFAKEREYMNIKVGAGSVAAFFGEISCLQVYGRELTPPLMNDILQNCYVNNTHPQSPPCPPTYSLMGSSCYKLSKEPLSFTEAELSCTSNPDDPYVMKLAFPENIQIQENLIFMAHSTQNISKLWIGLDSRSGERRRRSRFAGGGG